MEQTKEHSIGPALAVVVIVAIVAIAGIYFYKNTVKDLSYDAGATVVVPQKDPAETNTDPDPVVSTLSTSTEIAEIVLDIESELDQEIDLSIIDEIDTELLDFADLEDLDFEI